MRAFGRLLSVLGVTLCLTAVPADTTYAQTADDQPEAIVFSSDRSGPWRLWMVQPDGSDLRMLTDGKPDEHDVDPVFSPDSKSILFSSTRGGSIGVWRMPAGGSSPLRICDGDQADWSPDGRSIVFRRQERLFIRQLAGGKERPVSPEDFLHPSGPAWSPDGRQIAFACRWDAGNAIYLVSADGGRPEMVYDRKGACEPKWSPDGTRLVYETETHVATIGPDGKKNRPATWFGGIQRYPQWSPDGDFIVFCQAPSERGPWELYRIASGGGTPIKITSGGSDMNPDWR